MRSVGYLCLSEMLSNFVALALNHALCKEGPVCDRHLMDLLERYTGTYSPSPCSDEGTCCAFDFLCVLQTLHALVSLVQSLVRGHPGMLLDGCEYWSFAIRIRLWWSSALHLSGKNSHAEVSAFFFRTLEALKEVGPIINVDGVIIDLEKSRAEVSRKACVPLLAGTGTRLPDRGPFSSIHIHPCPSKSIHVM